LTNKRLDKYNGTSIVGRIQLHLEVIAAIRGAVGKEYLVAMRLGASDYTDGGTTKEDSVKAATALEKAGIDLSGSIQGSAFRLYSSARSR